MTAKPMVKGSETLRRNMLKAAREYAAAFRALSDAPAFHGDTGGLEIKLATAERQLEIAAFAWGVRRARKLGAVK